VRYTVVGFSQQEVVNRKMDIGDCVLLEWFQGSFYGGLRKVKIDGTEWAHVEYQDIHDQLPILRVVSSDAAYRRMKRLCNAGVMFCRQDEKKKHLLYRVNPEAMYRLFSSGEQHSPDDDRANMRA